MACGVEADDRGRRTKCNAHRKFTCRLLAKDVCTSLFSKRQRLSSIVAASFPRIRAIGPRLACGFLRSCPRPADASARIPGPTKLARAFSARAASANVVLSAGRVKQFCARARRLFSSTIKVMDAVDCPMWADHLKPHFLQPRIRRRRRISSACSPCVHHCRAGLVQGSWECVPLPVTFSPSESAASPSRHRRRRCGDPVAWMSRDSRSEH